MDYEYKQLIVDVLKYGTWCESRGTRYLQLFGQTIKWDLRQGFPLSTLRKMPFENIVRETLWDLRGESEISNLGKAKHFWEFLGNDQGYLVGSYGRAWRSYPRMNPQHLVPGEYYDTGDCDQLRRVAEGLRDNPTSRRYVINTYIPGINNSKCPPCHPGIVFSSDGTHLDMLVTARSNDLSVGFSLDFARYALISEILSSFAGLQARYVMFTSANNHIYSENIELTKEMSRRDPYYAPTLEISHRVTSLDRLVLEDFQLSGYRSHPAIKFHVC